jgi:GST-like protein
MNARDSAWNAGRGVGTAGLALSLLVGQIGAHGRLAGRSTVITFYYSLAPNPMKVALCLEEMGLAYEPKPVDTRKGEQHQPDFLAINPNGKVPVIIDQDTGARVFDSNAILLFLAEKTGQFLPETTPQARGELLSWLMFVATGVGPFSGQAVHFRHFAPEPNDYAVSRYLYEAKRHYGILDARLAEHPFMLGDTYTIVDMAVWGWARMVPFIMGEDAWGGLPNLNRLVDAISARPAAQAAVALKEMHAFKTEMDEEARRHMFRHLATQAP